MKENEYFDNTLFMKLVCVLAAIALVCVLIFVLVGAIGGNAQGDDNETSPYEEWTFAPDTSTGAPQTTDAPRTDEPAVTTEAPNTAEPVDTTGPADTTAAPDTTAPDTAPVGTLTPLPASNAILGETADMGQSYIDSIVFLGDSTTYGMIPYAVLSEGKQTKQVWTPSSGTLTLDQAVKKKIYYPEKDAEITAAEAAAEKQPKYLIITLGTNGVSFMNEEQFITEYVKLVQSIQAASPKTAIILQSIFPVAKNYDKLDRINNEKITLANTWVLKVAETCGVRYLDTASILHDADGWLHSSFQNGDGMHFNEVGFKAVLQYIRTHGYPEQGGTAE